MNKMLKSVALTLALLMMHAHLVEAGYLFEWLEKGHSGMVVDSVAAFIRIGRTDWRTMKDQHGSSLLHTAVLFEDQAVLDAIIRHRADNSDLNQADAAEMTPLHIAARDRMVNIVHCLVEAGAALDYHDIDGYAPIHYAVLKDDDIESDDRDSVKITKILVQAGAFLDAANDDRATPLHLAVAHGNGALIATLLAGGANPNVLNNADRTPLDLAIQEQNLEAVRLLVAHGAYTDKPDSDGDTPLHNAVVSGSEEVVRYFVEEVGAQLNVRNGVGETPLDAAVTLKNSRLVGYLMAQGASSELPLRWLDLAVSHKQQKRAEDPSASPTVLGTRNRESSLSNASSSSRRPRKKPRLR